MSGRDVRDVAEPIVEHLRREGRFYRLETINHRYPHCWRCGTPLVFRLVDEWFISMGPLYDQPRETLTAEQVDASLRYQIMDVVDRIRWIPDFGYERELDWLRNMHDWMISKKRYWGLALPIYDCAACGTIEVIGGRDELHDRAVEGWEAFEGHTPHRPYVDAVKIACPSCGAPVERIKDVGNPWLDAGIVPFSTLHYREDPEYWQQWFPADFITESFPGQFRNWFYSMLAMSTVLRREPPFETIFGYALVFAEDGRQMHKSWGNAIEFDEAADRMGVDVMRWMFAKARPEENITFGWHAADEARRELLILWNVYAFFVTYARLAGWSPLEAPPPVADRPLLDRWILSRAAATSAAVEERLLDVDALGATRALSAYLDGLSTWYLRLSRRRFSRSDDPRDQDAAFATLHEALVASARMLAPILPFLADALYGNLVTTVQPDEPDSVHLTPWPSAELARHRDDELEASMAIAQGAVDLVRGLRSTAHIRNRQPLATAWLALPDRGLAIDRDLLDLIADEVNLKEVVVIADDSALVERRVKPLLPRIGKRLGSAIPAVMAAARAGEVTFESDGSVTLAGVDAGARRGGDPGDPAAGHCRCPSRRAGRRPRHGAHPGARRGGRRPRARPGGPGPPARGRPRARRPDRPVGARPSRSRRAAPGRRGHGHARRPRRRRRAGRRTDRDRGAGRRPGRHRVEAPRRRSDAGMSVDVPGEIAGPEVATTGTKRTGAHWLVFLGTAVTVFVLDQISKAWLVSNLKPGETVRVIGDFVRLTFSQNSGALFGLFRDNALVFGIVSLVVVALIVGYHARAGRSLYLSLALGLLLGGALGNLADRLRLGYVVDFVDIGLGTLRFFTFNVGDSAITLAILMLIAAAIFPTLSGVGDRSADG